MKEKLNLIFELTKIRITAFVTLTTVFGYVSASGKLDTGALTSALGILLLACGSAVINHYQERQTDALMERTRKRPIPSGKISAANALMIAIVLLTAGSLILFAGSGFLALSLGLLNLFWYNALYTPLKKKNALAIIPGSVVGAIPPTVGWVAAGGYIFDAQILLIAFFFFIWQIPHFWLLLMVLDKDYEKAGFPTVTRMFSVNQFARITFVWIVAAVIAGLLIPVFGIVKSPVIFITIFLVGVWLTWNASRMLGSPETKLNVRFAFRDINLFALSIVVLISIDILII